MRFIEWFLNLLDFTSFHFLQCFIIVPDHRQFSLLACLDQNFTRCTRLSCLFLPCSTYPLFKFPFMLVNKETKLRFHIHYFLDTPQFLTNSCPLGLGPTNASPWAMTSFTLEPTPAALLVKLFMISATPFSSWNSTLLLLEILSKFEDELSPSLLTRWEPIIDYLPGQDCRDFLFESVLPYLYHVTRSDWKIPFSRIFSPSFGIIPSLIYCS